LQNALRFARRQRNLHERDHDAYRLEKRGDSRAARDAAGVISGRIDVKTDRFSLFATPTTTTTEEEENEDDVATMATESDDDVPNDTYAQRCDYCGAPLFPIDMLVDLGICACGIDFRVTSYEALEKKATAAVVRHAFDVLQEYRPDLLADVKWVD